MIPDRPRIRRRNDRNLEDSEAWEGITRNERLQELFDLALNVEVDQEHLRNQSKTAALLVKWDKTWDNLSLDAEISAFELVLKTRLGYEVEKVELQEKDTEGQDPQQQLDKTLKRFIEERKTECKTLIVYYGGHGTSGYLGELLLVGRRRHTSWEERDDILIVNWEPLEDSLRIAGLDILVILDCCAAGNRANRRFPRELEANNQALQVSKAHKFEVLCAVGAAKETLAKLTPELIPGLTPDLTETLPSTFTEALTWACEQLASGATFTTSVLLQTLFNKPNFPVNQFPELWKDGPSWQKNITLVALRKPALERRESSESAVQAAETYFDLRFYVANRPNEVQLQNLVRALRGMAEEGVFTPMKVKWQGFTAGDERHQDLNAAASIDFQLFDSVLTSGTSNTAGDGRSDDWIAKILNMVHKQIPGHERVSKKSFNATKPDKKNARTVNIAIIDTGYDSSHPLFEWVPHNVRPANEVFIHDKKIEAAHNLDSNGHGTHSTSLLCTIAPRAEIYVAKVVDGDRYLNNMADAVADAIEWAYLDMKVDIITMSFGFYYPTPELQKCIAQASKETLLFASASNNGANRGQPITYPALFPDVFCIHSTDAYGKPSSFTPYAQDNMDNFATLGENVRSAWPVNKGQGLEQRMSGTSTATPIAAGIAALVLEAMLADDKFQEEEYAALKSYEGMRQVLLDMAHPADKYLYLNPVDYFTGHLGKGSQKLRPVDRIRAVLANR